MRPRRREIDHPAMDEGSTVVDPHHDRTAVMLVRHADQGAKGQRTMCRGQAGRDGPLAVGGALTRIGINRGDARLPRTGLSRFEGGMVPKIARVMAMVAARIVAIKATHMPPRMPVTDLPEVAVVDLRRILLMLMHSYRSASDSSTCRYEYD